MKSRGLPDPLAVFVEVIGTDLGLEAANNVSRKRYSAARTTPRPSMRASEDEVDAMVEVESANGRTEEKVVRLDCVIEKRDVL